MALSQPLWAEGEQKAAATLSARFAHFVAATGRDEVPHEVTGRARACVADFLACALEAAHLPWGFQSIAYGGRFPSGPARVVGTRLSLSPTEAAFVNGALGHALVREDMHVASCTHLGVVVWPALFALAGMEEVDPDRFLIAGAIGYETGARIGRALFDTELQARIRPTGTVGAMAAAAAGAHLLGLGETRTMSAIGLAANMAGGLNEWPWAGGHEMVFHAAMAARNGVTATLLAHEGVFASPTALEGRAGLFAAYDRRERAALAAPLSDGRWEIGSVYFKPAPACNYAQTPAQAALEITKQDALPGDIAAIEVESFPAAIHYPGCNHPGPFPGVFEAKMSIQYAVAAVLVRGQIIEANYGQPDDPEINRLARLVQLTEDAGFEAAYPARQGAGVTVRLRDGRTLSARLDDVQALTEDEVFRRLAETAEAELGHQRARALGDAVARLGEGGSPTEVLALTARDLPEETAA